MDINKHEHFIHIPSINTLRRKRSQHGTGAVNLSLLETLVEVNLRERELDFITRLLSEISSSFGKKKKN